jgi:hypothetical protein
METMKRKILIGLLALGALGGFAAGFASLRCHRGWGHHERGWGWHGRHAAFEARMAQACADAALRARAPQDAP